MEIFDFEKSCAYLGGCTKYKNFLTVLGLLTLITYDTADLAFVSADLWQQDWKLLGGKNVLLVFGNIFVIETWRTTRGQLIIIMMKPQEHARPQSQETFMSGWN